MNEEKITIGRCKTCEWWVLEEDNDTAPNEQRFCSNDNLCEARDANYCRRDQLVYQYDKGGWFYPGSDFGCVHWEERT